MEEHGLEVRLSRDPDLIAVLGQESPDGVVLDMALPSTGGVSSLLKLRESRLHTGLPVFALTHPDLSEKEQHMVRELATLFAPGDEAARGLAKMLEASFQTSSR